MSLRLESWTGAVAEVGRAMPLPVATVAWLDRREFRRLLRQACVGTRRVEVPRVLDQRAHQVPIAEHQHMVQTLPPYTPHKPLTDGVGRRGFIRSVDDLQPAGLGDSVKGRPKLRVVVADQVLRGLP